MIQVSCRGWLTSTVVVHGEKYVSPQFDITRPMSTRAIGTRVHVLRGQLIQQRLRTLSTLTSSRPHLPPAQTLLVGNNYAIKYIDLQPKTTSEGQQTPTFVLLHGAPGSFQDFKYLIPLLQPKARVIGVNLPGNGDSQVLDKSSYYESIRAMDVHRSAYDAIQLLCREDENVFVVGHSFGGHATINVTALNEEEKKLSIRGMALVAPAGLRPHKAMQPRTNAIMWTMLRSNISVIHDIAREFIKFVYVKFLRFPDNAPKDHFVAGIVRCATTDFELIRQHVTKTRHIPAFFAWARDDAFMEEDVFTELSEHCHPGPRLAFDKGGHNIQKTRAELVSAALLQWTQSVMSGEPRDLAHKTIQHP